jgi:hypothetical protein
VNEQVKTDTLANRLRVAGEWRLEFSTWSNEALLSLSNDESAPEKVRTFAGWEFDYRIAWDDDGPADPVLVDNRNTSKLNDLVKGRLAIKHKMDEE